MSLVQACIRAFEIPAISATSEGEPAPLVSISRQSRRNSSFWGVRHWPEPGRLIILDLYQARERPPIPSYLAGLGSLGGQIATDDDENITIAGEGETWLQVVTANSR
jgi:hypothetical protein